jgi:thiol-disulfide isomerase/thioredoxin
MNSNQPSRSGASRTTALVAILVISIAVTTITTPMAGVETNPASEPAVRQELNEVLKSAYQAVRARQRPQLKPIRTKLIGYLATYPDAPAGTGLLTGYIGLVEAAPEMNLETELKDFVDCPHAGARALAVERGEALIVERGIASRQTQLAQNERVDMSVLRRNLSVYLERNPRASRGQSLVSRYMQLHARVHPDDEEDEWRTFLESPSEPAAAAAAEALRAIALLREPLDIRFTALDGREVDLAQFRGKVVLIDFWATWCGPCVAELPNVRSVHNRYHDRGFEVVGISLDRDTDRQQLIDFVAKNQMPWPQHFDGKGWKNELAVRYRINSIPATFLLGPDGRVIAKGLRGDALGTAVKRALEAR